MKQIVVFIFLAVTLSCMGVHAQKIVYAYDASGNCTGNTLVTSGLKSAIADTTKKTAQENAEKQPETQNEPEPDLMTLDENSIKVYPNPTNGQFFVEIDGSQEMLGKVKIAITSSQGRHVLILNSIQPINYINLGNQPSGTYILLITAGKDVFTRKVIVNK